MNCFVFFNKVFNIKNKKFTKKLKSFFLLLNFGVILTVFLSFLWFVPPTVIYILGLAGAVAQLLAFFELYSLLKNHFSVLRTEFGPACFFLLKFAGALLALKILMQLFSAFPYLANLAFRLKDFVIGYLHMVFLGIVIMATIAGMAIGGWMSGFIYDLTGSYAAAFINGIGWNVLNIAAILVIVFNTRRRRPLPSALPA